jgi:membrane protein
MSPQPHRVAHEAPPEALADDPSDFTREDYKAALKSTLAEIKKDDVPSMAAGVAFKIFLSLFPAVLAAGAVFSLVTGPEDFPRMIERLEGLLPAAALDIVERPLADLTQGGGGVALSVLAASVLGGLWAASSAAVTLIKALNRAYGVGESRKFVGQRLVALAITLALFFTLVGLALLLVAGPQITDALLPAQLDGTGIGWLLGLARVLVAVGVLILFFAFVYWLGPNREQPSWVWISPGAIVAVLGWLAVSLGFTLYVQLAGDYGEDSMYGATIGGVIVLMLWLQLSMLVMLAGAELNAEVEALRARHAEVAAGAGFGLAGPAALSTLVPAEPAGAAHAAEAAGLTAPPAPVPRARTRRHALPGLEETEGNGAASRGRSGAAKVGAAAATVAAVAAVLARRRQ